jgi:hypothetical protein
MFHKLKGSKKMSPQTTSEPVLHPKPKSEPDGYQSTSTTDKPDAREWNYFEHIYYTNIFWFILLHVGAVYGLTLCYTNAMWLTIVFGKF